MYIIAVLVTHNCDKWLFLYLGNILSYLMAQCIEHYVWNQKPNT